MSEYCSFFPKNGASSEPPRKRRGNGVKNPSGSPGHGSDLILLHTKWKKPNLLAAEKPFRDPCPHFSAIHLAFGFQVPRATAGTKLTNPLGGKATVLPVSALM